MGGKVSPDGALFLRSGYHGFTLHRFDDGTKLFARDSDSELSECHAIFSPDGTRIAWSKDSGRVSVWEVADAAREEA